MIGLLKLLVAEKKKTFPMFYLTFLIISMALALMVEMYCFGDKEIEAIARKTRISLVFSNFTDESFIHYRIHEFKKNPKIHLIDYISPKEAEIDFFKRNKSFSKELLAINPFPPIIDITIKKEFFNSKSILFLIEEFKKIEYVEEIRYNKDFIDSYMLVKENVLKFLTFFTILLSMMFILVLFYSIKSDYEYYPAEMNRRLYLGKNNPVGVSLIACIFSINIFILLKILISVFLTCVIFIFTWLYLREEIIWLEMINLRRLLIIVLFSGGLTLLISVISSFFLRRKIIA